MEDQNKSNTGGSSKKGLFSVMGGFSGWFSALLGKKSTPKPDVEEKKSEESVLPGLKVSPSEDSVAQDIKAFKGFVQKTLKKTEAAAKPLVDKGSVSIAVPVKKTFAGQFAKKVFKVFLIVFFLILLIFIGISLFREIQDNVPGATPVAESTPTTVPYEPYKKSVHADDPEVLQLEEEVNVLERELSSSSIREDKLVLPSLDFSVSFK